MDFLYNFINFICFVIYEMMMKIYYMCFNIDYTIISEGDNLVETNSTINNFTSLQFNYFLLFLFFCCAAFFSFLLFFINYLFVKKNKYYDKSLPYECGFDVTGSPRVSFNVQFYIIAILFLIFDVELVITYPWLVSLKFINFNGNLIICFFFLILLLSYFYESFNNCFNFKNFF